MSVFASIVAGWAVIAGLRSLGRAIIVVLYESGKLSHAALDNFTMIFYGTAD
jgi:hypothetical protein